ncbi:MAG: DEAD/DEAH box helicase, partial [Mangrovicoccus sp.]
MTFEAMGLDAHLIRALKAQEISEPTPIQAQAIPAALEGRDIMGIAQTGTGKTAAFGLPMAHNLMQMKGKPQAKTTRGLILAPTRELAKQIANNVIAYVKGTRLRVNLVVGGASIRSQVNRLDRGTDLLVATPGRLIDLIERGAIYLDQSRYLVLDEADQMLDLGFIHALRQIAPLLPAERQTMLFSATMPKLMGELADAYLKDPQRIEVSPPGRTAEKVIQELHYVDQSEKADLLVQHLNAHPDDLSIVFTRTKHGADKLLRVLEAKGFEATTVHGNKSQGQRERAIKAFAARLEEKGARLIL